MPTAVGDKLFESRNGKEDKSINKNIKLKNQTNCAPTHSLALILTLSSLGTLAILPQRLKCAHDREREKHGQRVVEIDNKSHVHLPAARCSR